MAAAHSIEASSRKAPSHPLSAMASRHRHDGIIAASVIAVILFPPLLILLGISWLAITDPSTFWMVVSLYFQTLPQNPL